MKKMIGEKVLKRKFNEYFIFIVFLIALPLVACSQENQKSVSIAKFDEQFFAKKNPGLVKKSTSQKRVLSFSTQGNSFNFMHLGPVLNSLCLMYENTKEEKYLLSAHEIISNVIASSAPNGKNFQSWKVSSSRAGYESANGKEWNLFEAHLFRYVVTYLYLVQANRENIQSSTILADNSKIVAFVEKNVWDKWLKVNNRNFSELTTFYGVRTHMGAQWAQIALGLSKLSKDATRRAEYTDFYRKYNMELRKNLKLIDGCYIWNSTWDESAIKELRARRASNRDKTAIQDVAHANQIIQYVLMEHEIDGSWTDTDIQYFANTFKSKIYNKETKSVYPNVDGSGTPKFINLSDGWMKLANYDNEVKAMMIEYHQNNLKKIEGSPYSTQFFSVAASI